MLKRLKDKIFTYLFSDSSSQFNKWAKWMWLVVFAGILGVTLIFVGLSFTDLPSVEELENPRSEEATQVFATNGEVLGRFYTENRVPISFEELSPNVVKALIATEDERYYRHSGIDFKGLVRMVAFMGTKGGASTITQQLARLLFTGKRSRSKLKAVVQKLKEWIIAVRLERNYTKEEIIALYLNKFNFINGAYGIKAASEIYFGKTQDQLTVEEAAMLVGMLQNPNLYNPLRRPEKVMNRRRTVLRQMKKNEYLTQDAYDSLKVLPLGINYSRQSHIDGFAPYFRAELAKEVKKILGQKEYLKSDGTKYNIYKDGLRIYTTIDPEIQKIAEEVMTKHMAKVQASFWRTWRNLDPWTYKTDSEHEISPERRKEGFTQLVRNSDRYQHMRKTYLTDIINQMKGITNLTFHEDDREIARIVKESDQAGTISKLLARGLINKDLATAYRKVLESDLFPELKTKWNEFQEKVDLVFKTPTEMKVFAYNDKMEADTTLTPYDSIRYHRMFLQVGSLGVDPKTGDVKFWIGGINHKYFQFDHVRINRQVGSTFKPFVYATAIAIQGFSPCYQVYDVPITIKPGEGKFYLNEPWTPANSHGEYTGALFTLKEALRKSKNTVSVYLMKQLGSAEPVRNLVDLMGMSKTEKYPNGQFRVPKAPSICLGATDLSVMEMTGAYTTFANNGIYNKPTFIKRIEDKNGNIIYTSSHVERRAIEEKANYVMVDMLRYSGGLGVLKSDAGGKTGTTNDYVDGWFMGITPNLVVGTWVGGEDKWIRFRSIVHGQGAYMAKPFFKKLMQRLEQEEGYPWKTRFYRPEGELDIELDCDTYNSSNLPALEEDDSFEDEGTFDGDIFDDEKENQKIDEN